MEYEKLTGLRWWMAYSRAFVAALGTAGIAFLTIIATKLLESIYSLIKERNKKDKEDRELQK